MDEPVRPVVRLVASSAPPRPAPPPRSATGSVAAPRLAVLGVLLGLLTVSGRPDPAPPAQRVPVEPGLVLEVDVAGIGNSQAGVLVLPVRVRNGGPAVRVLRSAVYAEPVREDPVLALPAQLAAGERRRVVAVVAPDCRLLRTGALRFGASVLLRVQVGTGPRGVRRDVVLDLAGAEVRERVRGLCSGPALAGRLPGLLGG